MSLRVLFSSVHGKKSKQNCKFSSLLFGIVLLTSSYIEALSVSKALAVVLVRYLKNSGNLNCLPKIIVILG